MVPKVVHCKKEPFDVYVGRGSKWGNPFTHKQGTTALWVVSSREEAVARFEDWVKQQPALIASLPELRGKTLGCWCAPQSCHGDVLMRLANLTEHQEDES